MEVLNITDYFNNQKLHSRSDFFYKVWHIVESILDEHYQGNWTDIDYQGNWADTDVLMMFYNKKNKCIYFLQNEDDIGKAISEKNLKFLVTFNLVPVRSYCKFMDSFKKMFNEYFYNILLTKKEIKERYPHSDITKTYVGSILENDKRVRLFDASSLKN